MREEDNYTECQKCGVPCLNTHIEKLEIGALCPECYREEIDNVRERVCIHGRAEDSDLCCPHCGLQLNEAMVVCSSCEEEYPNSEIIDVEWDDPLCINCFSDYCESFTWPY